MPVFEFETPQGRFQVEAPDQQSAVAALSQAKPVAAAPQDGLNEIANVVFGGLIEGVPIAGPLIRGGANRLGAGIRSLMSGKSYEDELKFVQEATGQLKERHPTLDTAAQIGGAIAGTVPMVAAAPAAFGVGATTRLGAAAASGASGAVIGGADAGVRSGGDLASIGSGALWGGGLGAVSPSIAEGVGKVAKSVSNIKLPTVVRQILGMASPDDTAVEVVADRLARSGQTSAQIANKMARAQASGTPIAAVDVMGPSGRDLLRTTTNVPGKARDAVATKLTLRDMASGDRVLKSAERSLSGKPVGPMSASTAVVPYDPAVAAKAAAPVKGAKITAGGYQAAKDATIKARSTGSKTAYDLAYSKSVPFSQELEGILQTPAGKAGLAAAKRNSANRREPWKQFFASFDDSGNIIDMKRVPDVRALDEVKRVLDVMVEGAKRPADGSPFGRALATPESIAIQSVRDDLLGFMVKETGGQAGAYAAALKSGASNIQADKALEFGRSAINKNPTQIALGLKAMNESEKGLARQGVMEAMREQVHKAGDTHNVMLRIFGSKEKRNTLRPFFPSQEEFARFRTSLLNEARMRRTFDASRGNSTTARQLMDMQQAGNVDVTKAITSTLSAGPKAGAMSVALDMVRGTMNRVSGMSPEVAEKTANLLLSRDPAAFEALARRLQQIEASKIAQVAKLTTQKRLIEAAMRPVIFGSGQSAAQSASAP